MGDQAEWAFQQQLISRMQQQQADEDDEAERAWQAALAAQQGTPLGAGLLDPKGKTNSGMPASLANVFQQPADVGLTQEEIEEEAERAWREALALQGGDEPMDEEAERAWQEALEAQQEELDLKDDEYYEELYRNTRINEGNKVTIEKEIIDLNEQRWKLRDKKAEYYSGMKDLMESSKALDVLRGTARTGKPLKGILKKRLERVKIDRRLTLRMTRSPIREGIPRKRVGFILPEEVDAQAEQMMRMKNQEVEKLMSKSRPDDNEEEFLEMSLQFIQDFKEEEERLKQESEEIKRMEEQVARLEAELAREGIALAQKYNSDNNHAPAAHTAPIRPQPKQQPDALEDAKNADLPARIKRGTKGFGGVFIDEVHKMLGEEELQKIEARIAGIAQEDAEDIANEGEDDEEDKALEQAADPALSARIKRGTKGFGGVFINEVHRMLEEEKKNEAANGTGSPPVPRKGPPVKPAPAPGAKPGPAPTTKPAPAAGTGMRLQLDKINKEEEQRKAAEAAAKKEEDDRKNQERLKQAAEARKILVSPRPATLPSTSPRGATPPTPAKPQPTTSPRQPVPTPTNNTTAPPPRGGNPPATNTTQQPPATTPSDPKKPWNAPAPTPRYGTSNPPSRPERSLSDPGSPKPPGAPAGGGGGAGVGGYSSTAQRLEAKQAPPAAGAGSGGRPSPPQPTKPGLGGSAPAGGSTQPSTQPPSPRKPGGLLSVAAAAPPATNNGSSSPKFYGPKPGAGSFIIKRTPTTPPAGTIPLASTTPTTATPPPSTLAPPPTTTATTSPTSPRAKPAPVKPLNHPEPVKRGVARPSNIDPTISAKANFFEQKQQSSEPVLSEEVLQRRARLEMFKTKVLAKNSAGQDNLKSPRVNS